MRRLVVLIGLLVTVVLVGAPPAGAADSDGDGVGNARDRCPTVRASQPDGCPLGRWTLNNSNHNQTDLEFLRFGSIADRPVTGSWFGELQDWLVNFHPATERWRVQTGATFTTDFGDTPGLDGGGDTMAIVGDWDGDGDGTVGVYSPSTGTFGLRNSNTPGGADIVVKFGGVQPSRYVRPVVGDWNGDGVDTIGLFRRDTGRWRLRNTNSAGAADLQFTFGSGEVQPLVGDWNGDGTDGIGTGRRQGRHVQVRLRNTASAGTPDTTLSWGDWPDPIEDDRPWLIVAGDWDGDGTDTTGLRR